MSEWQPIQSVTKDGAALQFKTATGEEYTGTWAAFWCGSDCPCDVAGEGDIDGLEEPICWCAYRDGMKDGEAIDPTHWMPLPPPPTE